MMKKIALIILLLSIHVGAQQRIQGTIAATENPPTWLILYQLKGAQQKYVLNEIVANGKFEFQMPQNAEVGMYRLTYGTTQKSFIDFLFLEEEITVHFNPLKPITTLRFENSLDNTLYIDYLKKMNLLQQKIDSIQLSHFNKTDENEIEFSEALYEKATEKYVDIQEEFEEKANHNFTEELIKQQQKYYAEDLLQSPQLYLNSEREHFFDYLKFNNKAFLNSNLLSEKIIGFVFYLNQSEDADMQNILYKNSVSTVVEKLKNYPVVNNEVQLLLLNLFSQLENATLVDFILANYYNKLPESLQDKKLVNEFIEKLSVAIGRKAPNFKWIEGGDEISLYDFNPISKTLLVFWSSTCSHCLVEIPKLHEYYGANKDFKIVAVALENNNEDYKILKASLPNFIHVLGLDKWENEIAKSYQINSTPTYFVLNEDKKIIAKPYALSNVKEYFTD